MRTDGQSYLDQLGSLPDRPFECRFAKISNRLGLGATLGREELKLERFRRRLCAIADKTPGEGELVFEFTRRVDYPLRPAEAKVGIGRLKRVFGAKNAQLCD